MKHIELYHKSPCKGTMRKNNICIWSSSFSIEVLYANFLYFLINTRIWIVILSWKYKVIGSDRYAEILYSLCLFAYKSLSNFFLLLSQTVCLSAWNFSLILNSVNGVLKCRNSIERNGMWRDVKIKRSAWSLAFPEEKIKYYDRNRIQNQKSRCHVNVRVWVCHKLKTVGGQRQSE